MRATIKQITSKYAVYIAMFIAIFIVHLNIEQMIDDLWFKEILDSYSVWGFIRERYYTWASRSFIEMVLIVLTHYPILIWQVADSLVYVLIAWLFGKIIKEDDSFVRLASCSLWMTYPFIHMNSAGYIATTLNYTWPLLGILGVVYFLKKQLNGVRLKWWQHALNIVCILYGANTEQGTAILFGVYVVAIGYDMIVKKNISKTIMAQMGILLLEMIYILTCPGNPARIAYETAHLFPEYAELGLLRKVEMGITSAMYHFLLIENIVFALFTFVLWQVSRQFAKKDWERVVCAIPFALSMCFSMGSSLFYRWFPKLEYFRTSLTKFGTLFRDKPESLLPCLVYAVAVIAILWSLYFICREHWLHAGIVFTMLGLGFGSRMMLGFSASIWASSDRTYIFMYVAFILSSLLLMTIMRNQRIKQAIYYVSIMTASCSYLSLLISVVKG